MSRMNVGDDVWAKIRATGPMTVAQYMREVLTAPHTGYYMNRDVFGVDGDFITSPEISQIFGELLAVWCIDQWHRMGSPLPLQLIELGPGRGTLADDILRVFSRVSHLKDRLSVHLVELSPALRRKQLVKLCGNNRRPSNSTEISEVDGNHDHKLPIINAITGHGFPITWYSQLSDVPKRFSICLAHEFFDALPVHKFQKTERGWSEVLVDIYDYKSEDKRLRFVLSPTPTPAAVAYLENNQPGDHMEISPQSGLLVEELAKRLVEDGGTALIADYGHNGDVSDTFRAFKNHKLHHPLCEPGTADLTADVNFDYLRKRAQQNEVLTYGPISQRIFLQNVGLQLRLQKLLSNCDEKVARELRSACNMLIDPDKMGERFKFFAIFPATMKPVFDKFPPSGFHST